MKDMEVRELSGVGEQEVAMLGNTVSHRAVVLDDPGMEWWFE